MLIIMIRIVMKPVLMAELAIKIIADVKVALLVLIVNFVSFYAKKVHPLSKVSTFSMS